MQGGTVHRALTNRVTHLVAESWDTDKSKVAISLGRAVMRPSWVNAVWEANHDGSKTATDPSFVCFEFTPIRSDVPPHSRYIGSRASTAALCAQRVLMSMNARLCRPCSVSTADDTLQTWVTTARI